MNMFNDLRPNVIVDPAKSIADQIYETLKNAIIRGEIEPNQRLFEVEVAKIFNASRTPVREAFRRLEQDGVAERLAQGGIRVPQFDEQTIQDLLICAPSSKFMPLSWQSRASTRKKSPT